MVAEAIKGDLHIGEILDVTFQCLLDVKRPGSLSFLGNMIEFFGQAFGQSN